MQNLNRLAESSDLAESQARMVHATIAGRVGTWFFLSGASPEPERAQRAASCLIEPERGDKVLVSHAGDGSAYILAVLSRVEPDKAELVLPGGVALNAEAGALTVQARKIDLQASEDATIQAPSVTLGGIQGTVRFQRLETAAQTLRAHFGAVHGLAQSVTTVVGRLVQRVGDSLRWIDEVDETRAGRVRMQVQDRFDVEARHASMHAAGQVKIDGEKIDLG